MDLLEYCNHPGGTTLSDLRRSHGVEDPHGVRLWCLGNEMDGPWQIGQMTAEQYGRAALDMARAMRRIDPTLELVACGSSGRAMPTFGTWERTVLEHTYDEVDLISAHAYYEEKDGDLASFLASGVDMDAFIDGVVAAADEIRATNGSDKRVDISFDEWNVWYQTRMPATTPDDWPVAPPLAEDDYTLADAVVVGDLLITLLRHADRVKAASIAQLVNVIAPIRTVTGGPAWRQTTFHPFALTARHAQPIALRTDVDGPRHATAEYGDIASIDAVATWDEARAVTVIAVNRDPNSAHPLRVELGSLGALAKAEAVVLSDDDPHAVNTADDERIHPRDLATTVDGDAVEVTLPPVSWAMIRVELA